MNLRDGVFVVRNTSFKAGQTLHTLTSPGEDEGTDFSDDAPAFGVYGLVSRPAPPANDNACEALVADAGGSPLVVATRDLRAEKVTGALAEGDVALWSVGNNCVLLKASGVLSIRHNASAGGVDAFIQIEPDGAIRIGNAGGGLEITPAGKVNLYTASGEALSLGGGKGQILAAEVVLASATTKLHAAAARPATFIPSSGIAGPAPNVFF